MTVDDALSYIVGELRSTKGQFAQNGYDVFRQRELEISRIEARLRVPPQRPNIERLRDGLTQRAAEWKQTLRTEPKVARLLLRRLIGPLELYDASLPQWQMPDFIKGRRLGQDRTHRRAC